MYIVWRLDLLRSCGCPGLERIWEADLEACHLFLRGLQLRTPSCGGADIEDLPPAEVCLPTQPCTKEEEDCAMLTALGGRWCPEANLQNSEFTKVTQLCLVNNKQWIIHPNAYTFIMSYMTDTCVHPDVPCIVNTECTFNDNVHISDPVAPLQVPFYYFLYHCWQKHDLKLRFSAQSVSPRDWRGFFFFNHCIQLLSQHKSLWTTVGLAADCEQICWKVFLNEGSVDAREKKLFKKNNLTSLKSFIL